MIFKIVANCFPERGGIQNKFLQYMAFNSVCFLKKTLRNGFELLELFPAIRYQRSSRNSSINKSYLK
jgi:hypothetical protein